MSGRDYGIDMHVEIFREGSATGRLLLLQIKGTTVEMKKGVDSLAFDVPVRTLRYSELFVTPVLLVLCPVKADPSEFYYLWLQHYVGVVLDRENPTWRANEKTVRVHIPISNRMPGKEEHLAYIAAAPQRLRDWAQLVRLHTLSWLTLGTQSCRTADTTRRS